jgi:hypothetical protein
MIPLIIFLSYKTGGLLTGDKSTGGHLKQYIYGSIVFAVIAGLLTALLAFILLKLFKRKTISVF